MPWIETQGIGGSVSALEREVCPKLNQARVGELANAYDSSEPGASKICRRIREIGVIENIEEVNSHLHCRALGYPRTLLK